MHQFTRFLLPVLLMWGLGIPTLFSQKYSNEFLSIGVGARAQALGNAVVASNQDVTAGYWNPAALAALPEDFGLQAGAMHAEWFAGIGKFDYLGITIPTANPQRRVGVSLIRFGIDGIPNTLSLYDENGTVNYDNVVEFSAADYALLLSYAQQIKTKKNKLLVGGNVKIVRRIIGSFANSWGFGLDLGAQYRMDKWQFGLMARDLSSTFNAWTVSFTEEEKDVLLATGNELPELNSLEVTRPSFILGASYPFFLNKVSLRPELDLIVTTDGQRNTLISGDPISVDPAFGLEAGYNELVFLRAGVNQFQKEQSFEKGEYTTMRPSLGIGLQIATLNIDYAFTDLGDSQNRYSHVVSLLLRIRKSGEE